MPNRIIRDSARTSPTLDALSDGAERCFWRLTTTADDYGRFLADPRTVLSACFPLKVGLLPVKRVASWLEEMGAAKLVRFYRVGDRVYGEFITAEKHFDRRARASKYPDPASADICSHVLADVLTPPQMSPFTGVVTGVVTDTATGNTSPRAEEPAAAGDWAQATWPSPEALAHLYNEQGPDNLPAVETLSLKRREAARRCLRQFPAREWWVDVFVEYKASRFLSGKSPPGNGHENFKPDFDWLMHTGKKGTENAVRVHDGVYR